MKKPANAGAHGLLKDVGLAVDSFGYAAPASALQVQCVARRCRLPASVAAVVAELAFPDLDTWRARV